ncbi:MAG TPA: Hsp20/alpha crystallin family protein [Candidatus Paceibacterota bacterium]|nr:Hsp20/alpha crystallin family protein [Candidatus Paceibacterota bacterium]
MPRNKRSFLERLTGVVETEDDYDEYEYDDEIDEREKEPYEDPRATRPSRERTPTGSWIDEEESTGELMVDVYQTDSDIVIQTMVAGVSPEDLEISITQEMVTIKGRREEPRGVTEDDYFYHELYWGPFSRTILLPQEIESEGAEAVEKNGLLTITLPKIDKEHTRQLRVKSL